MASAALLRDPIWEGVSPNLLVVSGIVVALFFLWGICWCCSRWCRADVYVYDVEAPGEGDPLLQLPGADWRAKAGQELQEIQILRQRLRKPTGTRWGATKREIREDIARREEFVQFYNARAVDEIFPALNPNYEHDLSTCDLHYLQVPEAEGFLLRHLELCRSGGVSQTKIITGWGKRSVWDVGVLKREMRKVLRRLQRSHTLVILREDKGSFDIKL